MTTRVKVLLGIAVSIIGLVAWGLLTWPEATAGQLHGGSVDLATCRIVEADQSANDRAANDRRPDEADPNVAPVPAPFQLFACDVLFPNQLPLTWDNPGAVGGLVVIGAIGTLLYLRHRRRGIRSPG
jgi:hypothetical protein